MLLGETTTGRARRQMRAPMLNEGRADRAPLSGLGLVAMTMVAMTAAGCGARTGLFAGDAGPIDTGPR